MSERLPDKSSARSAATAGRKVMKLRYAGICSACGVDLPVRAEAVWDKTEKVVFCLDCIGPTAVAEFSPRTGGSHVGPPTQVERPDPGSPFQPERPDSAGGSAQAEHDRRRQRREARLEAQWGRLAGVAKFLSDDPQSTRAWAQGAEGERRLAAHLARTLGDRAVFLHDRKVGRANIDHLVIASSGIWVVDAKNYTGKVEHRNVAGWLSRADWRVYVGGRDKTKLVAGLDWQVDAVRAALGDLEGRIHPALCFTSSDWGLFAKPFRHAGVLVTWASKLAEMIAESGDLGPDQIEAIAARLSAKLKPAT